MAQELKNRNWISLWMEGGVTSSRKTSLYIDFLPVLKDK